MGVDIAGNTISTSGSGIAVNGGFTFNGSGVPSKTGLPGFCGYKGGGNGLYYSATTGWEVNNCPTFNNGLNTTNGVFTCPVAGYYAMGFNGILNGSSSASDYGYACFAKNGVATYWIHWNINNAWNNGGCSSLFDCAAGDTLCLLINAPNMPAYNSIARTNGRGLYPEHHHCVWCVYVG